YLGHIAYGLPLGWLVQRTDHVINWVRSLPKWATSSAVAVGLVGLYGPIISPANIARDRQAQAGLFQVEGHRLNPGWLRLSKGEEFRITNSGPEPISLQIDKRRGALTLAAGETQTWSFPSPGIHSLNVQWPGRTDSSFVISEPVSEIR